MNSPTNVMWFANGQAAVFDSNGQQCPDFQGNHLYTYKKLQEANLDWSALTTFGVPHCLFDGSIQPPPNQGNPADILDY